MNSSRAYLLAFRHAWRIPGPLWRALMATAADITWLVHTKGVHQLERNLTRVSPTATTRQIRKLSRVAMRSYMRYFGEAFTVAHITPQQRDARVRVINAHNLDAALTHHGSPILALTHQGNWDLAGMWASATIRPVLTVAERLKPEELFTEFRTFRETLGMTILAAGDDGVFRALLRATRTNNHLICLLADRDLTASGIEVDFNGHRARVAKGPAALATQGQVPLIPVSITYEKLTGHRRAQAGSPWGIVVEFHTPLHADPNATTKDNITNLTQQWVTTLATAITRSPHDWHMLQKVFTADLNPHHPLTSPATPKDHND